MPSPSCAGIGALKAGRVVSRVTPLVRGVRVVGHGVSGFVRQAGGAPGAALAAAGSAVTAAITESASTVTATRARSAEDRVRVRVAGIAVCV